MEYFFTADEHFGHKNIIKYVNRPFTSVEEMGEELIQRHNSIVKDGDVVIHVGDFALMPTKAVQQLIIPRLRGKHFFLRGSHDKWMGKHTGYPDIWERTIQNQKIVACHYAMRTWAASHYNSWHLYGHSHGSLGSIGKSMDVGVDTHNFYPYSLSEIVEIMVTKPNNPNLVG